MMSLSGPRGCFVMGWNVFATSAFSSWGWGIWVGGWVCGCNGEKGVMIGWWDVEGYFEEGERGRRERRVMWWCWVGRNEPSSERGDYGGGRSRVNHASRNCCFLMGIHMGLVKWIFLDCDWLWTNGVESIVVVVLSWRITYTDVTAYGSDNWAVVKGDLVVVLQKNGVAIRRVLCESRCWRRGGLRMGW